MTSSCLLFLLLTSCILVNIEKAFCQSEESVEQVMRVARTTQTTDAGKVVNESYC